MVKLTLLFQRPPDEAAFETRYNQNLALVERLPGMRRRQAGLVLGSPGGKSPYYRILEVYFDNLETLDQALISAEGRAAGSDLINFAGHTVEIFFSEVFED